jgi:hypothetical protein
MLFTVALASFAVGMAVDRLVFSSGETSGDSAFRGLNDRNRKSSVNGRSPERSLAGSRSERQGDRKAPRERPEQGPDGSEIPKVVQTALEEIERGGAINVRIVSDLIAQIPAGRHRRNLTLHLASLWGRSDPESALEWAKELSGSLQQPALEHILQHWAETDPAGAVNYVAQLPNSEHNLHMVRRMTHLWAEQDRSAAMEWATAQTDPATRERALGGVVISWSQEDPAAAADFAVTVSNPNGRNEALEIAARHWANQNTPDAMKWANGLPNGDRQRATAAIFREVAERDPTRAASMYEEFTGTLSAGTLEAHEYRHMAREVASIWSSSNPSEAADWAVKLPQTGGIQREAVAHVAEQWLHLDSMAAGEWIAQLPQGETRDAATTRVVDVMSRSDPAAAFAWANSVSDEGHRNGLMRHVLDRWNKSDPGAARAAANSANVSPEVRREFDEVFGVAPSPAPEAPSNEQPESVPE